MTTSNITPLLNSGLHDNYGAAAKERDSEQRITDIAISRLNLPPGNLGNHPSPFPHTAVNVKDSGLQVLPRELWRETFGFFSDEDLAALTKGKENDSLSGVIAEIFVNDLVECTGTAYEVASGAILDFSTHPLSNGTLMSNGDRVYWVAKDFQNNPDFIENNRAFRKAIDSAVFRQLLGFDSSFEINPDNRCVISNRVGSSKSLWIQNSNNAPRIDADEVAARVNADPNVTAAKDAAEKADIFANAVAARAAAVKALAANADAFAKEVAAKADVVNAFAKTIAEKTDAVDALIKTAAEKSVFTADKAKASIDRASAHAVKADEAKDAATKAYADAEKAYADAEKAYADAAAAINRQKLLTPLNGKFREVLKGWRNAFHCSINITTMALITFLVGSAIHNFFKTNNSQKTSGSEHVAPLLIASYSAGFLTGLGFLAIVCGVCLLLEQKGFLTPLVTPLIPDPKNPHTYKPNIHPSAWIC